MRRRRRPTLHNLILRPRAMRMRRWFGDFDGSMSRSVVLDSEPHTCGLVAAIIARRLRRCQQSASERDISQSLQRGDVWLIENGVPVNVTERARRQCA